MLNANRYSRSIAIDYLKNKFRDENVKVVYVYFDYKAERTQTRIDIVRILLKQLLSQFDTVPPELESLYTLYDESICTSTNPDITTLTRFLTLCSQISTIYAIFDAIDECSDVHQMEVLELFAHLQQSGYRLLISSRPHLHESLNQLSDRQSLEVCANESDLRNYIIARLIKEGIVSDKFKAKCLDLINDVGGM
jgi:hypothetical protein